MTCKITLQIGQMSATVACSSNEDAAAILKLLAGFQGRKVGPVADTPWYPDDSGEWVEVPDDLMDMPPELDREDTVAILTKAERARRSYVPGSSCARAFAWVSLPTEGRRIVAYKVVKP